MSTSSFSELNIPTSGTPAERVTALLEGGVKLPPLPASGLELMNILRQPQDSVSVQRISALVENDPTLAANVLRIANSPAYGTARTVNRVSQAIMVLGLDETVQMLNYYLLRKLFPRVPRLGYFSAEQFWLHTWSVASAARALGQPQYLVGVLPGELYLAGLLHDIGKIMLAIYLTSDFAHCLQQAHETNTPLHEVEKKMLGLTHADVGARLLETWNIPPSIIAAVAGHHQPEVVQPAERDLVMLIELANTLAHQAAIGSSGNPVPPDLADTWIYRDGKSPLAQPSAETGILLGIVEQIKTKAAAMENQEPTAAAGRSTPSQQTPPPEVALDAASARDLSPQVLQDVAQRGMLGWLKRLIGH